jgi:hypothetical protein
VCSERNCNSKWCLLRDIKLGRTMRVPQPVGLSLGLVAGYERCCCRMPAACILSCCFCNQHRCLVHRALDLLFQQTWFCLPRMVGWIFGALRMLLQCYCNAGQSPATFFPIRLPYASPARAVCVWTYITLSAGCPACMMMGAGGRMLPAPNTVMRGRG